MSDNALRTFIREYVDTMNQSIVRREDGKNVIRKIISFKKNMTKYKPGDNVDTDVKSDGSVVVDDTERWIPDFDLG